MKNLDVYFTLNNGETINYIVYINLSNILQNINWWGKWMIMGKIDNILQKIEQYIGKQ